ncbi:MAG: hypothetical protein ACRDXX_17655, partial [Stackebrandtia sp.]
MASLDQAIAALVTAKPHLDTTSAEITRGVSEGDDVAAALSAAEVRERAGVVRGAADKAVRLRPQSLRRRTSWT